MIVLSYPVIGIMCLLAALAITFLWPLGPARRNHVISEIVIFVLFVASASCLWAGTWIPESISWLGALAIGAGLGVLAVVFRDVRRFVRYFRGQIYKYRHPYYWYGRVGRAVMGGSERRRRRTR